MSKRATERDEWGLGKVLSEDSGDLEPTTAGEALRRLIYVTPASEDDRDRIDSVIRFLYDLRSELHSRLRAASTDAPTEERGRDMTAIEKINEVEQALRWLHKRHDGTASREVAVMDEAIEACDDARKAIRFGPAATAHQEGSKA